MILDNSFEKLVDSATLSAIRKFEPVAVEEDGIKVEWEWIGEGRSGDYQPDDPEDEPLLRFTVLKLVGVEWEQIDDASYCTNIPITTQEDVLAKLARYILDHVKEAAKAGHRIKKACERLSWIEEKEIFPDEEIIDDE